MKYFSINFPIVSLVCGIVVFNPKNPFCQGLRTVLGTLRSDVVLVPVI